MSAQIAPRIGYNEYPAFGVSPRHIPSILAIILPIIEKMIRERVLEDRPGLIERDFVLGRVFAGFVLMPGKFRVSMEFVVVRNYGLTVVTSIINIYFEIVLKMSGGMA